MLTKIANSIDKVTKPTAVFVNGIGTVALVATILCTTVDVFSRNVFNNPIIGLMEVQRLLLVVIIFFGIGYCQITRQHVRVSIFSRRFPEPVKAIIDSGGYILSMAIFSVIVWRAFAYGQLVWEQNLVGGVLGWPVAIFVWVITFGCALLALLILSDWLRSVDWLLTNARKLWPFLLLTIGVSIFLATTPFWLNWQMGTIATGLLGMAFLVVLMLIGIPIGFVMAFIGFMGVAYLKGIDIVLPGIGSTYYHNLSFYLFLVIPFFLAMGLLLSYGKAGRDLYASCYKWVGPYPGGVSMATVAACGGFSAMCGESLATAVAMGTVALPEMKRFKYDDSLATGCVAAGGTLGILIPPSIGFILYAIITEESIGELFMAGIIPGILLMSMFMLTIYIRCRLNPKLGPPGPKTSFREKAFALKETWVMLVLFVLVVGGLYAGTFTPVEAGAIGAFAALVIGLLRRRFTRKTLVKSFLDTGGQTAMLFIILGGVYIMGTFLAVSRLPIVISEFVGGLEVSRYIILLLILLVYLVLGMLMNIGPMILLTLPIFYPTILVLEFNPVWFGVIMVIMMEMGQITPPVGMIVFAIAGVAKDVPMGSIFKGVLPFVACEVVIILILTLFPQIALWLPSMMR